MKPEHADEKELQRILALKRHEQPPRPFFKGLSSAVIDRIQNPGPPPPPTFLQKLGLNIDTKPLLVCLSAAAVCALLAVALIQARHVKAPPPKAASTDPASPPLSAPAASSTGQTPGSAAPVMVKTDGDRMNVKPAPAVLPTTPRNGN